MKTGRITRTVKNAVKNKDNPVKNVRYRQRNWHGYDENGVKQVTTAPAQKLTKLQKAQLKAKEAKEAVEMKNSLERVPEKDVLEIDTSGEERGYFKIGNKIIETIFPR